MLASLYWVSLDIGKRVEKSYVLKRILTSSPGNRPEASPRRPTMSSPTIKLLNKFGGSVMDNKPSGTVAALSYNSPATPVVKAPPIY